LGYAWILILVGFLRELFGSGTLWGYKVVPQAIYDFGYENNSLMIMPPMALILVGIIIWIQRSRNKDLVEK
jgi:Na+-transporting NADH:ubiquinone oxidoreductase subunit D